MNCPIDNTPLAITERQGVEIDYCPQCRGIWLDRGELDKIIEKAESPVRPPQEPREYRQEPQRYEQPRHDDRHHNDHHYKKKKRESFIGDLFDF